MLNEEKVLELKKGYEDVEIPDQLQQIVWNTINQAETELLQEKAEKIKRGKKMKKRIGSVAAALVIVIGSFGLGVNTNKAFADTVSDIPVLGSLAKVFTIEQVHEETDSYVADMKIPGIEGLKDKELQQRINELVHKQVTAAVNDTKVIMEENKKAFLETGGKEEDYMQQEISVDYDVMCLNDKILSFSVYKTETLASAYFDMFYYNYDLTTGQPLTLKDLLGNDYKEIANKQIKEQIAERSKNPDNTYWDNCEGMEQDAFKTIKENQQFYVNKKGNPVIVFNKYEIAPGYMGIQEFEIKK
ncbi:DUF3298 and DUF4163 domain-containing protein [Aminipila terrae]|uniref:DUF3298 domain-containing protein n=1 Tax=Aminipila terrae TaxID=2697030 RepID=A0A6P1MK33_9FIRM|nr:DUF3298 and DUF4163 domain-containing protein [Aminipila terrae]QHI71375.1 DUF3298 domain-containing protein [Aminipila terrae]